MFARFAGHETAREDTRPPVLQNFFSYPYFREARKAGIFVSAAELPRSCPAERRNPQGWRWRISDARQSRGAARMRQRQVAVRRLIASPVFVFARQRPFNPLFRALSCPPKAAFVSDGASCPQGGKIATTRFELARTCAAARTSRSANAD